MNGSAKRLMAVLLASVMIASAMVVVLTDEQDSSADDIAPANYYKSQLEMDFEKSVYNSVVTMADFGSLTVTIDSISVEDRNTMKANQSDPYYLSGLINKSIIAAVYDNPLVGYYISSTYPAVELKHDPENEYTWVKFTVNKVDPTTPGLNKDVYDGEMTDAINDFYTSGTVSPSDPIPTKIEKIHDYVTDTLTYSSTGDPTVIRSVYTTLCGDHNVVCEGYAKMFKVLCDKFDIPCLIVTGKAGDDGEKENHMWNYVQIDDKWYLVDCTWDDQATRYHDYLMAGISTEAEHFGNKTIAESYDPSGLDTGLIADMPLSYYSYGDDSPQYLVTFLYDPEMDPEKVYKTQYVGKDATAFLPADPADGIGHHFLGWYQHGSDTEYDFSTPVTGPLTIDGKWTTTDVYTLKYETDGGTVIQATRVESTDNVTKITETEPKKEGYKFIEWNTAKNGGGISYKGGEDITLVGDCTLYAIWEDTSSVTFKIDSIMAQAAEFLSKESIPGVSNFLLTIGVITTVVSLIAVIAIARK